MLSFLEHNIVMSSHVWSKRSYCYPFFLACDMLHLHPTKQHSSRCEIVSNCLLLSELFYFFLLFYVMCALLSINHQNLFRSQKKWHWVCRKIKKFWKQNMDWIRFFSLYIIWHIRILFNNISWIVITLLLYNPPCKK